MQKKNKGKQSKMPRKIFAQVSPRSVGGVSMFDALGKINSETVDAFASEADICNRAVVKLQEAGFDILQVTNLTINIAGSQKTYDNAFNTKLELQEREVIKGGARKDTATFIECPDTDLPGLISTAKTSFDDVLEGVAIEEPYYVMSESMYPPNKEYWHLRVPAGISLATNSDKAHRANITGRGVKVAMIDTGHYKHRWFVGRGYRVAPVVVAPGASNPLRDDSGHGTAESANIFSVAPVAELMPVKLSEVFDNSQAILKGKLEAKDISLNISSANGGNERVLAEPISLTHNLLSNIISNAIKFSHKGDSIDIVISNNGEFVQIDITDKGIGIPSEILKNLFRTDVPTSRQGTAGEIGTGFGMPLVKKYVDLYGGKIEVKSRAKEDHPKDHGTTISLFFLSCAE